MNFFNFFRFLPRYRAPLPALPPLRLRSRSREQRNLLHAGAGRGFLLGEIRNYSGGRFKLISRVEGYQKEQSSRLTGKITSSTKVYGRKRLDFSIARPFDPSSTATARIFDDASELDRLRCPPAALASRIFTERSRKASLSSRVQRSSYPRR